MAEKIFKEETNYTPGIDLDPNKQKFEFTGVSRPEDTYEFYEPILSWVENYVNNILEKFEQNRVSNETFVIVFDFKYMNSSSSKYIFQILSNFKKLFNKRLNVTIFWYYDDLDDQILEDGEDFSEIINIPFKFLTRNQ
ncbi:MAG: DUF1987 domain-containing protein [Bacteroidales bacterium]